MCLHAYASKNKLNFRKEIDFKVDGRGFSQRGLVRLHFGFGFLDFRLSYHRVAPKCYDYEWELQTP